MYLPEHFTQRDQRALQQLIIGYPLATLVVVNEGEIVANSIPLRWVQDDNSAGRLQGHVARANPLWQLLGTSGSSALALFHGPQAYISPNWYPTKQIHGKVVPTWNYVTVQVRGSLRAIDDVDWKREFLRQLTAERESDQPRPWSMDDAPIAFTSKLLGAIVGLEMAIVDMQGKWKISQNQPTENQRGIVAGLSSSGHASDIALSELVSAWQRR